MSSTSSMPKRLASDVDPSRLTTAKNVQQATSQVNRMARRDPALYPLSIIMVGIAGVTGYFFMTKASNVSGVERNLRESLVNPWDDESKHDVTPGQVAAFKYRYKSRDGHMEDGYPVMNVDIRKVEPGDHKYYTTVKKGEQPQPQ